MAKKTSTPEQTSDTYGSTILGFIVVLVLGIFLFNVFRNNTDKPKDGTIGSGESTSQEQEQKTPGKHIVQAGETLWDVSVAEYGTGYNWSDIAEANNLTNADNITEGMELTIPNVTPIVLAGSPTLTVSQPTATQVPTEEHIEPTQSPSQPSENTHTNDTEYTVAHGDTLWAIAIKEYGNGYRWVDIAQANNLANPDIIHAGNKLALPR